MYNGAALSTVGGGGAAALAATGPENLLWLALASFALIAAGAAVRRIVPRREARPLRRARGCLSWFTRTSTPCAWLRGVRVGPPDSGAAVSLLRSADG
jgi:hypothetical protein